jgi:hypothetical protein
VPTLQDRLQDKFSPRRRTLHHNRCAIEKIINHSKFPDLIILTINHNPKILAALNNTLLSSCNSGVRALAETIAAPTIKEPTTVLKDRRLAASSILFWMPSKF